MKMGTIASPGHYDAAGCRAQQSANLRRTATLRDASTIRQTATSRLPLAKTWFHVRMRTDLRKPVGQKWVFPDQRIDHRRPLCVHKPEATSALTIRLRQWPSRLYLHRISLQERQVLGHVSTPHINAGCRVILKQNNQSHSRLQGVSEKRITLHLCRLKAE
jgi:hypothetical protein